MIKLVVLIETSKRNYITEQSFGYKGILQYDLNVGCRHTDSDSNRFLWCLTRDGLNRRHVVGFAARHGVGLDVDRKQSLSLLVALLIVSGDVSQNPGPRQRCHCPVCKTCVRKRGIQCDGCDKWVHPECVNLSEQEYNRLGESDEQWFCPACHDEAAQENELNDMFADLRTEMNMQGLRVAHINCCSLIGKFTEINMLLQNCNVDVLGITETHLNQRIEDRGIAVEGYELQRFDRVHKKGGGCLVYYREDLDVVPRPDLRNNELEAIWIEVICKSQRLLIGTVYRAPDNTEFYDIFEDAIYKIWQTRNNILIMGDSNSDLLRRNTNTDLGTQGKKLQRILNRYSLKNVTKSPTRIAKTSETLIDLILTSNESKVAKAGTSELSISDHKLVYSIIKLHRARQEPRIITVKNYKNIDTGKLQKTMDSTPWWIGNIFEDVDDVWNTWELLYNDVINEFVKTRKAKVRTNSLPWITTEERKALNRRYRLLCKWQRTKDPHDHDSYKKARNFAKKSLKSAESNYWKVEFQKANNSKDFWNTVKRVQRKRTSKRIGPIEDDNGVIQTDDTIKADLINDYVTSVREDLAKKLPTTQQPKHSFISRVTPTLDIIDIDEEHLKSKFIRSNQKKQLDQTILKRET
eukprot:Seg1927.10 transcript_id=Seg1927.10/GoldUCD/mRNA.D3Y31 product="hypothetical protein" protein_id=Seg1927.10/GoldUCD/D3Y31